MDVTHLRETLIPLREHVLLYGIDFQSNITSAAILFDGLLTRASKEPLPSSLHREDLETLAGAMSRAICLYLSGDPTSEDLQISLVTRMRNILDQWNESQLSEEEIQIYRSTMGGSTG